MPGQRKTSDLFNYLTKDDYAKEVRIFNYGQSFIAQFVQLRKYIYGKKNALNAKFARYNVLVQLLEVGATLLMYILLINSAVSGMITIGGLVIYIQLLARMQSSVSGLFQSFIGLFQNQLYLRQILVYLSVDNSTVSGNKPFNTVAKEVRVQNLNFISPDTETAVLQNVSMVLKPGQIIAIVGENGSGKSTFIKLLCKLYNVEHGQIQYDGHDIAEIDGEHLRTNISVVFQDYGKYYSTVEENIAIGEIEKDSVRLDAAAKKAGAFAKINRLSKGYKTILGRTYRNGEQLSGGEWQKIALARGLYKNSQILILDEPTSAMDPHAEHAVFENIKQDLNNKIVILITHRLYNLKLADNIYVFENGTIAESGTFDGLIKAKGHFYDMYSKQGV
jgi:ATP-binding cassette subfamily B protein